MPFCQMEFRRTNTPLSRVLLLSTILMSGFASPALAQTALAPEQFRANDEHGVDLATGTFNMELTQGSIGPGDGGVTMKFYLGRAGMQDNWSGILHRTVEGSTEVATITFGDTSERFTKQGGVWVSAKANGATLTETQADLQYTYKTSGGRTLSLTSPLTLGGPSAAFNPTVIGCSGNGIVSCALPVETVEPDGTKYTLTWHVPEQCVVDEELNSTCTRTFRLSDVRSSASYGMKVKYQSDQNYTGSPGNQGPPPSTWYKRSGLKFFDLSQVYCDPTAANCDGVAGTWPTVTYAYPASGVTEINNTQNGTWRIEVTANQYKIRRPGSAIDTTVATLDANYKVSSVTDDGQTKTYVWGTAPGGNPQVTTTDGTGAINSVTIPTVTTTPRPLTVTNGLNQTTSYIYDANGRTTRETRPEGDYTNFAYDSRGNITESRVVAKLGSGLADIVTTANYDAICTYAVKCNKPNYTIDAKGNRTDYTYDLTTGEVTRVQMPAAIMGGTRPEVNYAYSMLSAQIKDAGGNLIAQPAQAKLTQITACATAATCSGSASETKITVAYNTPNLLPTSITTAAGDGSIASTVAYTYDARDNITNVDGPLPGSVDTVTYIYDPFDRRRGVIGADPDGTGSRLHAAERYTFDNESRTIKVETGTVTSATEAALNAMTVYQTTDIVFDANGNKVKETVSGTSGVTQVVQMSYDADQRLKCTALRMNPAIFSTLPSSACTLGSAGAGVNDYGADRITEKSYDANGRVTLVKTAVGTPEQASEVTKAYTANGRTAYVVDAENNRTTFVYDGFDRLRQTQYPGTTKGANASNAADYEQLTYDANGNMIQRRLRDGQIIVYSYDNLDRIILKNLPGTEPDVTYSYDLLSRMAAASQTGNVLGFNWDALGRNTRQSGPHGNVDYTYDVAGRRLTLVYPGTTALTVNYDYDNAGNLLNIRENGATSGIGVLATYTYDDLGRRSSITRGNGTVTDYAFDANQRISSLSSNLSGTAYDQTTTFGYNPAGQLDTLTKSNDAYAWLGHYNVDRVSRGNGMNQLKPETAGSGQISVPSLGYDALGNLITSGTNSYTYSSENLMRTAPNSVTLRYDPAMRLYQTVGGGATTRFLYDGNDLIAEYNASNLLQRRYVQGPGSDEPVLWYEGSGLTNRRWFHTDERGSVTAVTDGTGTVLGINSYDEYGIPAATNYSTRFSYTGQTWIPVVGMYYYKARMYSPTLGRFMQTDPIGYGDGLNWHNYVGSDPVNASDTSGLCRWSNWTKYVITYETQSKKIVSVVQSHSTELEGCNTLESIAAMAAANADWGSSGVGSQNSINDDNGEEPIVVSAKRPWTTFDFVNHYFTGKGAPVSLADVGLAGVFENHPSVKRAIRRLKSKLAQMAWGKAEGFFTASTTTNVRDKIFSVAGSQFFGSLTCTVGVCMYKFSIRDAFVDALDLFNNMKGNQEAPGGTPYDINHDFDRQP